MFEMTDPPADDLAWCKRFLAEVEIATALPNFERVATIRALLALRDRRDFLLSGRMVDLVAAVREWLGSVDAALPRFRQVVAIDRAKGALVPNVPAGFERFGG